MVGRRLDSTPVYPKEETVPIGLLVVITSRKTIPQMNLDGLGYMTDAKERSKIFDRD